MAHFNMRKLEREDSCMELSMQAIDAHLLERREQIIKLQEELTSLKDTISIVNDLSGRASTGHGSKCECSYCLIHKFAYEAWKLS